MELSFDKIYNQNNDVHFVEEDVNIGMVLYDDELIHRNTKQENQKFSYDDILNFLNMSIVNGNLQYINNSNNSNTRDISSNKNIISQTPPTKQAVIPRLHQNIPKQNYIYNKYFKNYKNPKNPKILPPMTPQQFKKYKIHQYLKRIEAQKRIDKIKSKKLLFSNNHTMIQSNEINNNNLNKLFKFP